MCLLQRCAALLLIYERMNHIEQNMAQWNERFILFIRLWYCMPYIFEYAYGLLLVVLWCSDANANKVVIVILAEFTEPIPSVFQFKHATHLHFDLLLSTLHPKSGIVLAKHHESGIVTTFVCTIWFYYIRFHNNVQCIQNPELSSHTHRWHVQYNEWAI